MKKLISTDRERKWYLIKKWVTKSGLKAQIRQCVWNKEVHKEISAYGEKLPKNMPAQYRRTFMKMSFSLPDHYVGYVEIPKGDKTKYYDNADIDVHGGVTFDNSFEDEDTRYAGFDMGHYGDENIPRPIAYAVSQCEKLAKQIKKINAKK